MGLYPSVDQVLLGPHHEESRDLVDSVEPFEVVVSPIHGEDGTGLQRDQADAFDEAMNSCKKVIDQDIDDLTTLNEGNQHPMSTYKEVPRLG